MPGIDDLASHHQTPTALRPLQGLTVLVVEDSRFASEAVRLLCTRSGAQIRRADGLRAARKHLAVYHPSVLLVDVGLPDGTGLDLITGLAETSPRIAVILGTSADPDMEKAVLAAGADGFIEKPIASLAQFQSAILRHLPAERQPPQLRVVSEERIKPDRLAYQDDLVQVAGVLGSSQAEDSVDYITQFLGGVARSARDEDLDLAVRQLKQLSATGAPLRPGLAALNAVVKDRLEQAGPI
jgi:CheY-like chemotaxis protein